MTEGLGWGAKGSPIGYAAEGARDLGRQGCIRGLGVVIRVVSLN